MATIKLIIRNPNRKGLVTVFMQYQHKGKTALLSTGVKVPEQAWNKHAQRIKKTHTEKSFNVLLQKQVGDIEQLILHCRMKDVDPTPAVIKSLYRKEADTNTEPCVISCFNAFIESISSSKAESTVKVFERVKSLLIEFDTNPKFEKINKGYMIRFMNHMEGLGMNSSTVKRNLTFFKSFLQYAFDNGYHKDQTFRNVKVKVSEKEVIHLTREELEAIQNLTLTGSLSRARSIFLILCMTGLRYSDYLKLTSENFQGDFIVTQSGKTKKMLRIPITPALQKVLDGNKSLVKISNQRFNVLLKRLCKAADIKRWREITSHCGRKTFVSLCLQNGMQPHELIGISHHSTSAMMKHYYKADVNKNAEVLRSLWS